MELTHMNKAESLIKKMNKAELCTNIEGNLSRVDLNF